MDDAHSLVDQARQEELQGWQAQKEDLLKAGVRLLRKDPTKADLYVSPVTSRKQSHNKTNSGDNYLTNLLETSIHNRMPGLGDAGIQASSLKIQHHGSI